MVNLKKILREAFFRTSLQDEDWLEPSTDMLTQIESRIYTKKKDRRWLFLLPFLLLLLTIGGVWFGTYMVSTPTIVNQPPKISKAESIISELAASESITNPVIDKSSSNTNASSGLVENNPIISVQNSSQTIGETSEKKIQSPSQKPIQFQEQSQKQKQSQPQNKKQFQPQKESQPLFQPSDLMVSSLVIPRETVTDKLSNPSALTPISLLDTPTLAALKGNSPDRQAPPIKVNLKQSTWSFVAGTGVSFWQFKLNDSYRTALAPADFQFSNGVGTRTFVGVDKKISKRFSLGTRLAYERVNFTSGHNSTLPYDRTAETDTDHSNTKMVAMATPVGFIESDLVINRETDVAGSAVLIDIKNRHRIQSLDWQLMLDYSFPKVLGLTPTLNLGAGVHYISKVTNELNSFTPQAADFTAGKGEIVADQSSLRSWSPTVTTGFGLEKNINKTLSVGINGSYLFNLNELQKSGEFSTRVNRLSGGIYLRRNF